MGRTQLASKNILLGLFNNGVILVLGFVNRAIFLQTLGATYLGVNSVLVSTIQMLALTELGLTSVMLYSYYTPLAVNDIKKLSALVSFFKKIYLGIALAVLLIGGLVAFFLPVLVNGDISLTETYIAFGLYLLDACVSYLFIYKSMVLRADQKGFILTGYGIVISIFKFIGQMLILFLFSNFALYVLVAVISTVVLNIVSARKASKEYNFFSYKESCLERSEIIQILKVIKSGFIYKLSAILLNSTTNIMISILIGTLLVGYLENYTTIITSVTSISVVIFSNMIASVGNLAVKEKADDRLNVFNQMLLIGNWLTIVFVVCSFLLSNSFITLWLGKEYVMDSSTVILKFVAMFMSCAMQPIFCFREAVGLYRKTQYIMLAAAIVNVSLGCFLGYYLGLNGILLASIFSCVLTYMWYEPKILYKEYFETGYFSYFVGMGKAFAITVVLSAIGLYLLTFYTKLSWLSLILQSAIVFFVSNVICYMAYKNDKSFADVKLRFITLIPSFLLRLKVR